MQKNRIFQLFSAIFCVAIFTSPTFAIEQIAVVFVVDQFAHHMLSHVKPYFKGGIKLMLEHGVSFENAHYPYAGTATGPGHACLNTGALPKDNGIVKNSWFDLEGNKVTCDQGPLPETAVFTQAGTVYPFGKSAAQIKVDGISDQLIFASKPNAQNAVYSFSLKPRAAVCAAGKQGKAFWFDINTGALTTGKAYFSQLPAWLTEFNKNHELHSKTFSWNLVYPQTSAAYSVAQNSYYPFSRAPSILHQLVEYDAYIKLPESNRYLLEASKACLLDAQKNNPKKILLWICLSSLDPVGHAYGPHSVEYSDTLYHIDKYVQEYITWMQQTFSGIPTLYILTADHGSAPMPELTQKQGLFACRVNQKELQYTINNYIAAKYGIEAIVTHIDTPSLYLDKKKLARLNPSLRTKILSDIKQHLKKFPSIHDAWTFDEVAQQKTREHDIKNYFNNSLFAGRSGDIQFQIKRYCFVSKYDKGTSHSSPYDYTTHVPLIVYLPGKTKQTTITVPVTMMQVAPTLAQFFSINPPSASNVSPLPDLPLH